MKRNGFFIVLMLCLMALAVVSCDDNTDYSAEAQSVYDSMFVASCTMKSWNDAGWDALFAFENTTLFSCDPETHIYSILPAATAAGYALDNSEVVSGGTANLGSTRYYMTIPAKEERYPSCEVEVYSSPDGGIGYLCSDYMCVRCGSLGIFTHTGFGGVDGKNLGMRMDCNAVTYAGISINKCTFKSTEYTNGDFITEYSIRDAQNHEIEVKIHEFWGAGTVIEKATYDGIDIKPFLEDVMNGGAPAK